MKEVIRQYGGAVLAVMTALLLLAVISAISIPAEQMIPAGNALTAEPSGAFESYWRMR